MLTSLKQTLMRREYDLLSEELDEMILLGEDEELFSDDELGLNEGATYSDSDFDDIPEDDVNLGDDDIDELLDETDEGLDLGMDLSEYVDFSISEGCKKPSLCEEDDLDDMLDDEEDDFEDDVDLSEFIDPEYLIESDSETTVEADDKEDKEDESLAESLFFAEFMEM